MSQKKPTDAGVATHATGLAGAVEAMIPQPTAVELMKDHPTRGRPMNCQPAAGKSEGTPILQTVSRGSGERLRNDTRRRRRDNGLFDKFFSSFPGRQMLKTATAARSVWSARSLLPLSNTSTVPKRQQAARTPYASRVRSVLGQSERPNYTQKLVKYSAAGCPAVLAKARHAQLGWARYRSQAAHCLQFTL